MPKTLNDDQLAPLKTLLGRRVKQLRNDANLTQRQVAEQAGLNQANLSRIEQGKGFPRLDSLLRLQHCFELDTVEALLSPLPSRVAELPAESAEDEG